MPRRFLLLAAIGLSLVVTMRLSAASPLHFPANFNGKDLTALLRPEHPRLFATSEDWQRIRAEIPASPELTAAKTMIVRAADAMLTEPPLEHELTGKRMLFVSREMLKRVLTLATAWRVTDEPRYLACARGNLLTGAAFPDWNPSHFLDTAEMTMAMAIGYDWLWHDLSPADRTTIRDAILNKGLKVGAGPPTGLNHWKLKENNWVQACFGGLVGGALAIAGDQPDLAATYLGDMFSHIHQALSSYEPDGVYPEGPGYWIFGTHYSVMLDAMMQSALGTTWNLDNYPGFQASAVYINEAIGPTGLAFNYGDGDPELDVMPALHWFAAHARHAALDARERQLLLTDPQRFVGAGWSGRFFPFTLLWLDPALPRDAPHATLPLAWWGNGLNPIAILRSSWKPDALFIGLKGGRASNGHGHMDIGSFVLDWKGVRWAFDFGGQSYHSLEKRGLDIWGYHDPASQRWDVFRINNFSHNTLVIDGKKQLIEGFAPITKFSDDHDSPSAVVDMTAACANAVTRAIRGVRLIGDRAVLIQDELAGLAPGHTARWGMMTRAEVKLHGDRAILRLGGQTLHARILDAPGLRFEIVPTDPPPHDYDAPNPGTRMLAVSIPGRDSPRDIRIVFSSQELSPADEATIIALPTPSKW